MTVTNMQDRLEQALDDTIAEQIEESRPWAVTDAGSADWALRKLAKTEAAMVEVELLAQQQIEAIAQWRADELERLKPSQENWRSLLAIYHHNRLEEDPRVKTIRLPHGTLTARKQPDGIEIENVEALIAWAEKEAPFFVRTKVEIDRATVKEAVLKHGEVVPGVTAVAGDIKFTCSTDVEQVEG